MKNQYKLLTCFLLCVAVYPLQAQFSCRYDPNNVQVPNPVSLPYNVTSIAANTSSYLSTTNYLGFGTSNDYMAIEVNATSGVPGVRRRTTSAIREDANSIVYAYNNTHSLKAGSKDNGGQTDMFVSKNDALGSSIWSRYLGVSSYVEEAMLIVQDDASYGTQLGTYLVVGISNRYGTRSPYIARIEDLTANSMTVLWQKTYDSGLNIDEIPTSVHKKANGDYVIAGHTEGSSVSTLFTFEIDIATGKTIGNWVNYHVSSLVDETNAYIQRSQSGAGGYVMSYTVGDGTGSAIGVMEIDNTRNTVFWNNTYYETYSNFNHSVAIHWNGTHYVLGTGHFLAASGAGYPGFLTLTVAGAVNSLSLFSASNGTFSRTQSMIQTPSSDYLMKVLYANTDGYGLIKTNSTGGGANLCNDNATVGVTPLVVDPDATDVDDDDYFGLVNATEPLSFANGQYIYCNGTSGPYLPKATDKPMATVEEWDVPGHQLSGTPTSVSQPDAANLKVFPNPSNGSFQVQFGADLPLFYEVTDMSGKTIVQGRPTSETESVHLKDAKAGMYLLKVQFVNEQWTQKISVR